MNIIQIQDRLKGVTDEALVGYVENPTGDVPTYLALGELGRREEMRKKYQAQAQPTETVAEEIVAKASVPTGIGALTNTMEPQMTPQMTPQMAPQEEVMSESITETGVANLPAPNVGQNYANGGIIDFSQTNIEDAIYNPDTGTMLTDDLTTDTIGINPNRFFPFGREVESTYGMLEEPKVADYKTDLEARKAAFGIEDTFFDEEREALKAEREEIAKKREGLMPDAMIRAGLGIAGGTSGDFVQDLTAGVTPAFEQFVKDDDLLDKEEKLLRKENRAVDKMMRAEAMGDMKGFDTYNKEIRGTQLKLIEINFDKQAKALANRISASAADSKAIKDAFEIALKQMKSDYGEDQLITRFRTNPKEADKERIRIVKRILKSQGISGVEFDLIDPKGGIGTENKESIDAKKVKNEEVIEVSSREEIEALPAGTIYKMPDGTFNIR